MKLQPIELNIRASWAINCAVAMGEVVGKDLSPEVIILDRAKMFLKILDQVKAIIEPPLLPPDINKQNTKARKVERKEDAKNTAEIDLRLSEMHEEDFVNHNDG